MIALDALHQLPLKEKLFVMEALWDDLSRDEDTLNEREAAIADGTGKFIDWEDAKRQITEAVK
ncbi:MAG: addiction module protein [Prosthecobacter sp.]|nr:addiction module protein [Prosthecobacter sp.]